MLANKNTNIWRKLTWLGMLGSLALILAACGAVTEAPPQDINGQVATIVALTQAAQPPAVSATPEPVQPTATSAPLPVTLQLAPDLQTILALPESKLTIYTVEDDGTAAARMEILGGTAQTQFELPLGPGSYRIVAVYAPMEGFDLLGLWAADGSSQQIVAGGGFPESPLVLTRPSVPCAAGSQRIAEQLGLGAGFAQINACSTGRIVFSFDPSITNPPAAAVYAISEGMFSGTYSQDIAMADTGTQFTLDVPPGEYTFTARSVTADDPSFFGVWGASGLALVRVEHYGTSTVYLTRPGDPCLAMYQLGPTPDGRFPETAAYKNLFRCGEATPSTASDEMGEKQLGRKADGVESFSEASYWYQYEDDKYEFEVKDGYMKMEGKQIDLFDAWVTAPVKLKNFYLEGTFKVDDTCGDWDRYGLLVRAPKPAYGYVFSFTCGGRFRLYYMDGDKYVAIQEWKASDAIVTGSNATNRMGVWMQGSQIRLYANGKLLGEYTDKAFDEGIIGVHLGSVDTPGLQVKVDEIQWWDLDK